MTATTPAVTHARVHAHKRPARSRARTSTNTRASTTGSVPKSPKYAATKNGIPERRPEQERGSDGLLLDQRERRDHDEHEHPALDEREVAVERAPEHPRIERHDVPEHERRNDANARRDPSA